MLYVLIIDSNSYERRYLVSELCHVFARGCDNFTVPKQCLEWLLQFFLIVCKSRGQQRGITWILDMGPRSFKRNSAAAVVQASAIQQEKAIHAFCHPVDLAQAECNCGNSSPSPSCLVSFMPKDERYSDSESLNLESLNLEDEEDDNSDDQQSKDDLHAETFKVKVSVHEDRYQQRLLMCDNAIRKKQTVSVRVKFEPDNIEDRNAIKIEVYFDNVWHIIGYCGVHKIPKLRKAMKGNEIVTVSFLLNVKREWIPWQRKFSFYASINIVKRGQWEKDSPKNYYNSNLDP